MTPRKEAGKPVEKFRLSEDAVRYIEEFILKELNPTTAIDKDSMGKIIDLSTRWEINMIDTTTENYQDKTYDYPEKVRDTAADKFVSEITGKWDGVQYAPDFDDLNTGLHLL